MKLKNKINREYVELKSENQKEKHTEKELIQQILKKEKTIFLVGEAGIGKSYISKHILAKKLKWKEIEAISFQEKDINEPLIIDSLDEINIIKARKIIQRCLNSQYKHFVFLSRKEILIESYFEFGLIYQIINKNKINPRLEEIKLDNKNGDWLLIFDEYIKKKTSFNNNQLQFLGILSFKLLTDGNIFIDKNNLLEIIRQFNKENNTNFEINTFSSFCILKSEEKYKIVNKSWANYFAILFLKSFLNMKNYYLINFRNYNCQFSLLEAGKMLKNSKTDWSKKLVLELILQYDLFFMFLEIKNASSWINDLDWIFNYLIKTKIITSWENINDIFIRINYLMVQEENVDKFLITNSNELLKILDFKKITEQLPFFWKIKIKIEEIVALIVCMMFLKNWKLDKKGEKTHQKILLDFLKKNNFDFYSFEKKRDIFSKLWLITILRKWKSWKIKINENIDFSSVIVYIVKFYQKTNIKWFLKWLLHSSFQYINFLFSYEINSKQKEKFLKIIFNSNWNVAISKKLWILKKLQLSPIKNMQYIKSLNIDLKNLNQILIDDKNVDIFDWSFEKIKVPISFYDEVEWYLQEYYLEPIDKIKIKNSFTNDKEEKYMLSEENYNYLLDQMVKKDIKTIQKEVITKLRKNECNNGINCSELNPIIKKYSKKINLEKIKKTLKERFRRTTQNFLDLNIVMFLQIIHYVDPWKKEDISPEWIILAEEEKTRRRQEDFFIDWTDIFTKREKRTKIINYLTILENFYMAIENYIMHNYVEIILKKVTKKNDYLNKIYASKYFEKKFYFAEKYLKYKATKLFVKKIKKEKYKPINIMEATKKPKKINFLIKSNLLSIEELKKLFKKLAEKIKPATKLDRNWCWYQDFFSNSFDEGKMRWKLLNITKKYKIENFFVKNLEKHLITLLKEEKTFEKHNAIEWYISILEFYEQSNNLFKAEKKIEKLLEIFHKNKEIQIIIKNCWNKIMKIPWKYRISNSFSIIKYYQWLNQKYDYKTFDWLFQNKIIPKIANIVENTNEGNWKKEILLTKKINENLPSELEKQHSISYQPESNPYLIKNSSKRIDAILYADKNIAFLEFKLASKLNFLKKIKTQLMSYSLSWKPITHKYLIIFLDKNWSEEKKNRWKKELNIIRYKLFFIKKPDK